MLPRISLAAKAVATPVTTYRRENYPSVPQVQEMLTQRTLY
jgi:hypothetical protein